MKRNQEFRLDNAKSMQTFSLSQPGDSVVIHKIVILSLSGVKKPNDWFQELCKQDLNLKMTYSDGRGLKTEYTLHLVPLVSPNHARPVFDERRIHLPLAEDMHNVYTKATVEIFSETPEVPFEVSFTYDATPEVVVHEVENV